MKYYQIKFFYSINNFHSKFISIHELTKIEKMQTTQLNKANHIAFKYKTRRSYDRYEVNLIGKEKYTSSHKDERLYQLDFSHPLI